MKSKQTRLYNITFIELMLISFATSLGYSMIATLISSYSVTIGASLTYAGIIAGVFSIAALTLRPFGGFFSDNFNKKYLLVITTVMLAACFLGYSVCHAVVPLILIRLLHGAAFGINTTVNLALAAEYIPDERMNEGFGVFGIGQVISQIIGPTIGLWIKDFFSYTTLFIICAILVFLSAMLALLGVQYDGCGKKKMNLDSKAGKGIHIDNFIARECILYALIGGIFSVGNGVTNNFLVLIGKERMITNISLFFVVNATLLFLLRLTIGKILDKVSILFIVNISLAVSGIAMLLIGYSYGLLPILVAAVLKACGNVGGQISLQTACVKKVDACRIGIATSTYYIGSDLGNGFGPILAGKIADVSDYKAMFLAMASVFMIGMIVFSAYIYGKKGKINEKMQN